MRLGNFAGCAFRCFVLGGSVALAPLGQADDVNPVPSDELCPDGSHRLVWTYPFEAGIPDNATRVECEPGSTCFVFPESACLETVEVTEGLTSERLTNVQDPPRNPATLLMPRLPEPRGPVRRQPIASNGDPEAETLALPDDECKPGSGWDFEEKVQNLLPTRAQFDPWEGSGLPFEGIRNVDQDFVGAPVYGNAAPIDRIRPPGWLPAIAQQIGGDYWIYSQSVNRHGDFWVSSNYRRYSWGQHPGDAWGGAATGTLQSPECTLRARYLAFRMSGKHSARQRVEVQVRGGNPRAYVGLMFNDGFGDWGLPGLPFGRATQVIPERPLNNVLYPPPNDEWTTVRSAAAVSTLHPDWMQTYVFDLEEFRDSRIRIRAVDDVAPSTAPSDDYYINVDYFRFTNDAPDGVEWWAWAQRRDVPEPCDPRDEDACAPVGHVPSEPPLWGITDAHAHPMANLAFGGHVIWGDASDSLANVYDCSRSLPGISGPGGREAITRPAGTSACYVAGDVTVIVTATLLAACTPLNVIPVVGVSAAFLCKSVVSTAQAALFTTPIIQGLTLHGAGKFANGAFFAGGMLSEAWLGALREAGEVIADEDIADPTNLMFAPGLLPSVDAWPNAHRTAVGGQNLHWYPTDKPWHSLAGLGKTHNHYQVEMIRRAYHGGLRLAVWDVVNSRGFALIADGRVDAPDWQALKDQTDAAKRIVGNNLAGIAAIAYSPEEARSIIRSGRIAVILGTEVDELGRMRPDGLPWPRSPATPGDSMAKQVDDLWALGIRKITPVHAVNNPIGGAAIFQKDYVANNHFLNGTPLDATPSFFDEPPVRFFLDRSILGTVVKIILGSFSVRQGVGTDGKTPWNNEGWFELGPEVNDPFVGDSNLVTYRIGEDDPLHHTLQDGAGNWLPPQEVLNEQILVTKRINDLSTLIRPTGTCDIYGTVWPDYADSFGPVVDAQFTTEHGHRNAMGIYRNGGDDGEAFLRAAMRKGMLLDVDHLSQAMRVDVYQLAADFAREAGWQTIAECDGTSCGDYPLMGVHTTVRNLEKEGSKLPNLIDDFGSNNESTRTPREIAHVTRNGGTIGLFPRPASIPPNTQGGQCTKDSDCMGWIGTADGGICDLAIQQCKAYDNPDAATLLARNFVLPAEVENDCDGSSKTFAVKYLWLLEATHGKGLTFTSDLNGLISSPYPRFGDSMPGKPACGAGARASLRDEKNWQFIMSRWQWLEHSGIWYDDYAARNPTVSPWAALWEDPYFQPPNPNKRWKDVIARKSSESREDRAPRFERYSDGTLIQDHVYYNDFGRVSPHATWMDQTGNVPGAQLYPMKRWQNIYSGWDFNLDGFQHIGLLPDLMQDMRNVGVQWEQMQPMLNGAEDFVSMWVIAERIGQAHPN